MHPKGPVMFFQIFSGIQIAGCQHKFCHSVLKLQTNGFFKNEFSVI